MQLQRPRNYQHKLCRVSHFTHLPVLALLPLVDLVAHDLHLVFSLHEQVSWDLGAHTVELLRDRAALGDDAALDVDFEVEHAEAL